MGGVRDGNGEGGRDFLNDTSHLSYAAAVKTGRSNKGARCPVSRLTGTRGQPRPPSTSHRHAQLSQAALEERGKTSWIPAEI
jgi:hypothetical protein